MGAAGAGAMMGISLAQAYGQSESMRAQGDYQNTMSQINSRESERMSERALKKGNKESQGYLNKVKQMIGTQKTAYAAGGVEVGYGSAKKIQDETYEIGQEDARTIQNNAFLEAMGYRNQAFNQSQQGRIAQISSNQEAGSTLITGGLRAASIYQDNFGGSGVRGKGKG